MATLPRTTTTVRGDINLEATRVVAVAVIIMITGSATVGVATEDRDPLTVEMAAREETTLLHTNQIETKVEMMVGCLSSIIITQEVLEAMELVQVAMETDKEELIIIVRENITIGKKSISGSKFFEFLHLENFSDLIILAVVLISFLLYRSQSRD